MSLTVPPAAVPDESASCATDPGAWLNRISSLLAPALIFLTIRQVSLLVLAWSTTSPGLSVRGALTAWDGAWFLGIAVGGYTGAPEGLTDVFGMRSAETPLAFFPGYPALIAVLAWLPGVGVTTAAFLITICAGVVTAYGLTQLGELVPRGSRTAGLVLVALFAASPMSIVLSMTYSEALFCALAAWGLVGLLRQQWLLAGLCSAAAGVVRPSAAALVAAVVITALVAVWDGRDGARPWVAALLTPTGLVGYLAFVAERTGRWDGWFAVQRQGWETGFDGGAATLRFTSRVLSTAPSALEVVTVGLMAGALALLVVCLRDWWRSTAWPLLVYGAVLVGMVVGSDGLMNSKARLLLPAFVLLLPVAIGLAGRRPATVVLTLAVLVAVSAAFGAYALTRWPYAI